MARVAEALWKQSPVFHAPIRTLRTTCVGPCMRRSRAWITPLIFPRTFWRGGHARVLTNIGLGRADERGAARGCAPVGTRVSISYVQLITRNGTFTNQNVKRRKS